MKPSTGVGEERVVDDEGESMVDKGGLAVDEGEMRCARNTFAELQGLLILL